MTSAVPAVKISHNAYAYRIWSPHGKAGSFCSVYGHHMGAHFFIGMIIYSCTKSLFLFLCHLSRKGIRVFKLLCFSVFCYTERIGRNFSSGHKNCKISCLIFLFHRICLFLYHRLGLFCLREKALQQYPVRSEPWSHNIFWRYFLPVYDRFNSWPVHIVIRFSVHLLQPPD